MLRDFQIQFYYLFDLMVLPQQSIRTVRYTHRNESHAAYHYHGYIDVGEDEHYSRANSVA